MDVSWVGVDTLSYDDTELQFQKYDAKRSPFRMNSSPPWRWYLSLHHGAAPLRVLEEALRVTRDHLIILEDIPKGKWGFLFARLYDYLAIKIYEPNMATLFQFKGLGEWMDIFTAHHLEVARAEGLKTQPLAFMKQMLCVLKKR